jgi:hypothetical protein
MSPLIQRKTTILTLLFIGGLVWFGLLPKVYAVVPAPDGGYPGFNTAEGQNALLSLTTGSANTGLGWYALSSNTDGSFNTGVGAGALLLNNGVSNTAVGTAALLLNTAGARNTAVGSAALQNNTADENTAVGADALSLNTTGTSNTAVGTAALLNNTAGSFNTANGRNALLFNTTGSSNTANGRGALQNNTEGSFNTASGRNALFSNTAGSNNTANGYTALQNNSGDNNTAIGSEALANNTTGGYNTANGVRALASNTTGVNNVAIGTYALENNTTGGANIALGNRAGTAIHGGGNVCIGADVHGGAGDDQTWIKNVNTLTQNFSAGVNDYVTVRLSDGRLGHTAVVSSQRYKHDIKPLATTSEALYELKPVSFRLKKEFDASQALGFGLIAEEVEKVDPALVYRNAKGQVESVRYEMVNAMLLNEFLKEHRKVEQLTTTFESKFAEQQKQIDALTAGLQKVSAQLELNKPAPQTVLNQ